MCITDCQDNGRCLYDNIILGDDWGMPWQASTQSILSCNSELAGCPGGWFRYGEDVFRDFGIMKEKSFPCRQAAAKDSLDGSYTSNSSLLASCDDFYEYACKYGAC